MSSILVVACHLSKDIIIEQQKKKIPGRERQGKNEKNKRMRVFGVIHK
jgi:hypothetical protein